MVPYTKIVHQKLSRDNLSLDGEYESFCDINHPEIILFFGTDVAGHLKTATLDAVNNAKLPEIERVFMLRMMWVTVSEMGYQGKDTPPRSPAIAGLPKSDPRTRL